MIESKTIDAIKAIIVTPCKNSKKNRITIYLMGDNKVEAQKKVKRLSLTFFVN